MSETGTMIHLIADGINLSRNKVMGRQTATEAFYRGYIRYGAGAQIFAQTQTISDEKLLKQLVAEERQDNPEVVAMRPGQTESLSEIGTLITVDPNLSQLAWTRRLISDSAYSLVGMTHTLSSAKILTLLSEYHFAPIQEWDALVCTSTVAQSSVRRLLDHTADLYVERLGVRPDTRVQLPIIPLPIDCDSFEPDASLLRQAAHLRNKLAISNNDCVFLYFGRFSFHAKANPYPMFVGLEKVAKQRKNGKIVLLMVGQAHNEKILQIFRDEARRICSNVVVHFLDGRDSNLCRQAWSAADVFVSLSDNIQETFGLTVVEAMASGLPVIVSDWNGYRDTVVDGVTGIRIPTLSLGAGNGQDIADRYAAGGWTYDRMVGYVAASAMVDVAAFAAAAELLANDPDKRRAMGAAGYRRARTEYDMAAVFKAYSTLRNDLAAIRASAEGSVTVGRHQSPDPFAIFADHPTRMLTGQDRLLVASPDGVARAMTEISCAMSSFAQPVLLPRRDLQRLLQWLVVRVTATVDQIANAFADLPLPTLQRTLVWLLKYEIAHLISSSPDARVLPVNADPGAAAFSRKDFAEASRQYRLQVVESPMNFSFRRNLLVSLKGEGRYEAALPVARSLVEDFPEDWKAHYELARTLVKLDQHQEAESEYKEVLRLHPGHAETLNELGVVLRKMKQDDAAMEYFQEALRENPNLSIAHANIGNVYLTRRRYDEAIEQYEKVLRIDSQNVGALINIGTAYKRMGALEKAERFLTKALAQDSEGGAASNLAYLLLSQGKYRRGWPLYRRRASGSKIYKAMEIPPVESMPGKILHVMYDQGLGDEIFFLRFLPQLIAKGITVRYKPNSKIMTILKRIDSIGKYIVDALPNEDVVFRLLVGDLPLLLQHGDTDAVPPSLIATPLPEKMQQADDLLASAIGPLIGVAWRGGTPDKELALFKEVPLEHLAAALRSYPGTVVILQRNPYPGEVERFQAVLGRPAIDLSQHNADLELMLAVVAKIDDMAGVSNTNVHLRALCGKGGEVLVPNPPDFRWYERIPISPWFPEMSIYRQGRHGEWALAFMALRKTLEDARPTGAGMVKSLLPQDRLDEVRDLLRAGNCTQALSLCIELEALDAGHPRLAILRATSLLQLKRYEESIPFFELAMISQPEYTDAMVNIGAAYEKMEFYQSALKYYNLALRVDESLYRVHTNIGLVKSKLFSYDGAIEAHRRAIEQEPDYIEAHQNLVILLMKLERYDEALVSLEVLTRLRPEMQQYWANLASARCECGDQEGALAALAQARKLGSLGWWGDILEGRIHQQAQRPEEGERCYRQALAQRPTSVAIQSYLLGLLLDDSSRRDEAELLLQTVMARHGEMGKARSHLLSVLMTHNYLEEAEILVRDEMQDGGRKWSSKFGMIAAFHLALGNINRAESIYSEIIAKDPGNNFVTKSRGLAYLSCGYWEKGWGYYLGRSSVSEARHFLSREILPDDLSGQRILLGREQGIGDEIFFLRFAPELKRRGAWIGYVAAPKMVEMFRRLPFLDQVETSGRAISRCDRRIPVGDLPWLFRQFSETQIPSSLHLLPKPELLNEIAERLASLGPPPYFGVVWQAGSRSRQSLYKEVPRRAFASALRDLPGTVLSLQRLAPAEEHADFERTLGRPLVQLPGIDDDIERSLALMALLDELIGVSNTNVHLRAMVNRTGKVLVPFPPEFRWMHLVGASPWFPEFKTYRKSPVSGWEGVFRQLKDDLCECYC